MAEITDTINEVETKTLPTGTVTYLIKLAGGLEVSTLDREIAKEAYGLVGSKGTAYIEYTEKKGGQFGQFTNRYLNEFKILDGAAPLGADPLGPPPDAGPPPGLFDDTGPETLPFPPPEAVVTKDRQIARAVALKAAVDLMPHFVEEDRTSTNVTGVAEYFEEWLLR